MNSAESKAGTNFRPCQYWRLWVLDAVLVSAGFWFYLATQYGTREFLGKACAMALLPLIPIMVLVGGAGSTVFALTKVFIERRDLPRPVALALLAGPALALTVALGLLVACKSYASRLDYICLGNAPGSASQVQITGYSTFLREEWLAVFRVNEKGFQAMVAGAKLEPVPDYEFNGALDRSSLTKTRVFENRPQAGSPVCFRRVFKESQEHQRGGVYAAFDPATSTAIVFRRHQD